MGNEIDKDSVMAILGSLPAADRYHINIGSGPQIEEVENMTVTMNGLSDELISLLREIGQRRCSVMELSVLDHERYNLFVLRDEDYNSGVFSISKDDVFKYTLREDYDKYYKLGPVEIAEVRKLPAIFATRNRSQKQTDNNHPFLIGIIDDITDQGSTFKICFRVNDTMYRQQILNLYPERFSLNATSLINEMDEVHWEIKRADLLAALQELENDVEYKMPEGMDENELT